MSENNLKFHYQLVRTKTDEGTQLSLHEAFSTDKNVLYMISPIPAHIIGDTKEDIQELVETIDKDIESYGIANYEDIQAEIDQYGDYAPEVFEINFIPDDVLNDDELLQDDNFHDESDKVLDLVQYMGKKR